MKKTKQQLLLIPLLIFLAGCGSTGVLPGNDEFLVNAQRTATSLHTTMDSLVKIERENDATVRKYLPSVHTSVNKLREEAPKAEDNLWAAIETYRLNRDETNKANVNTYLATAQKLLDEAKDYTNQIQTKTN